MRSILLFLLFCGVLSLSARAQDATNEDRQVVAALQQLLADPKTGPAAFQADSHWCVIWPGHDELEPGVQTLLESNVATTTAGTVHILPDVPPNYVLAADATLTDFVRSQIGLPPLGDRTGQNPGMGFVTPLLVALLATGIGLFFVVRTRQRKELPTSAMESDDSVADDEPPAQESINAARVDALEKERDELLEALTQANEEIEQLQRTAIELRHERQAREVVKADVIEPDKPLEEPTTIQAPERTETEPRIRPAKPLMGENEVNPKAGLQRKVSLPVHKPPEKKT